MAGQVSRVLTLRSLARWAGKLVRLVLEGGEIEAQFELTGTQTESLLKYASAQSPPLIRAHFCGSHCDQKRSNPDLVHLKSFRKLEDAAEKTWGNQPHCGGRERPAEESTGRMADRKRRRKGGPAGGCFVRGQPGQEKEKEEEEVTKGGLQPEKNQEVRGQVCGNEAPEGSLQRHGFRSGAPYPQEGEKACEKEVEAIQRFVQHELVRDKFQRQVRAWRTRFWRTGPRSRRSQR